MTVLGKSKREEKGQKGTSGREERSRGRGVEGSKYLFGRQAYRQLLIHS